jgi:hypothetical protein
VPTHPGLNFAVLDVNLRHVKARVQVILLMLVDHDYKDCLQPGQLIEGSVAKYWASTDGQEAYLLYTSMCDNFTGQSSLLFASTHDLADSLIHHGPVSRLVSKLAQPILPVELNDWPAHTVIVVCCVTPLLVGKTGQRHTALR